MTVKVLLFLIVAFLAAKFSNRRRSDSFKSLLSVADDDILVQLVDLKCKTFLSGFKMGDYYFNRCDLVVTRTSVIIYGYSRLLNYKWYARPLVFSPAMMPSGYASGKQVVPKKVNLHSFDNSVYIEFVISGFMDTNVDLKIFDVPEEVREKMVFLENPNQ